MELEKLLAEYAASIIIADEATPSAVRQYMEENSEMSAGLFLKRLKELRITGSEFLELLGNSKIGNAEFRKIQNNPHMRFEELLDILDNSNLENADYKMMIAVASKRNKINEERKLQSDAANERAKQLVEIAAQAAEKKLSAEAHTETQQQTASEADAVSDQPKKTDIPSENEKDEAFDEASLKPEGSAKTEADPHTELEEPAVIEQPKADIEIKQPSLPTDKTDPESDKNRKRAELYLEKALRQVEKELNDEQEKTAGIHNKEKTENDRKDDDASCIADDDGTDHDGDDDEIDEEIKPDAKTIGSVLEELCEPDNEANSEEIRVKRPFLRISLALAAALICIGVSYKLLRHYQIIPTYTYHVTEKETQDINDYATLLSESRRLAETVDCQLPDGITVSRTSAPKPIRISANGFVLTADSDENKCIVKGAKFQNGILSDAFSFESELSDAFLLYTDDKFVLVGESDGFTVILYYTTESIVSGESVCEIKQTGECIAYYTDSKYAYILSRVSNDLDNADAEQPNTFLPYYEQNGRTGMVQFDNITSSACVFTGDYYLLTRSDGTGAVPEVKAINSCDSSAAEMNENGLCVSKTYNINGSYKTEFTSVIFGGGLEVKRNLLDGFVYPSTFKLCGEKVCCIASVPNGSEYDNTLLISDLSFEGSGSSIAIEEGICADGSVCGDVYSFMKNNDRIYGIDTKSAEEVSPFDPFTIKADEDVYVKAYVEADSTGKRSGIRVLVCDSTGAKTASDLIAASGTAQDSWNDYISTPAQDNILSLAVCHEDNKVYIGVPVTYFDGVSAVSEYVFYIYENKKLTLLRKLSVYSAKNGYLHCDINEDGIVTFWNERVITADKSEIKVISDIAL